jgi:hypothetical protein
MALRESPFPRIFLGASSLVSATKTLQLRRGFHDVSTRVQTFACPRYNTLEKASFSILKLSSLGEANLFLFF